MYVDHSNGSGLLQEAAFLAVDRHRFSIAVVSLIRRSLVQPGAGDPTSDRLLAFYNVHDHTFCGQYVELFFPRQ